MKKKSHQEHHEHVAIGGFLSLSCCFQRDASGEYRVTCADVPDVLAFGSSLEDARENVRDELIASLSANPIDHPFFGHCIERN